MQHPPLRAIKCVTRFVFSSLLALLCSVAHADTPDAVRDTNFRKFAKPTEPGDGKWEWALGLGVTLNRGNEHATRSNFTLDGIRAMQDSRLVTQVLWIRSRARDEDRSEIASASFRGERNISQQAFGFGEVALDRDIRSDIAHRSSLSLGLGRRLLDEKQHSLNVYAGLARVSVDHYEARDRKGVEALFGEDLAWQISDTSRISQRLVVYPYTVGAGGLRTVTQLTLSMRITERFSLQLAMLHKYQARVPEDGRHNDLTTYTGLATTF